MTKEELLNDLEEHKDSLKTITDFIQIVHTAQHTKNNRIVISINNNSFEISKIFSINNVLNSVQSGLVDRKSNIESKVKQTSLEYINNLTKENGES